MNLVRLFNNNSEEIVIKQYMNPFPTLKEVEDSEDSKRVLFKILENTLELGISKYERIYEKEPDFIELNEDVWDQLAKKGTICSRLYHDDIELKKNKDVPYNFIYFRY